MSTQHRDIAAPAVGCVVLAICIRSLGSSAHCVHFHTKDDSLRPSERSLISRLFVGLGSIVARDVCFALSQPFAHSSLKRTTIEGEIMESAQVQEAVARHSTKSSARKLWAMTRRITRRMVGVVDNNGIRLMGWMLTKVWRKLFPEGVHVHNIEAVLECVARQQNAEQPPPIVFVPTHKSHLDYLLLSYILFSFGEQYTSTGSDKATPVSLAMPFIAAGNNLDIPIVRDLLNRCGAFFIRRAQGARTISSSSISSKDPVLPTEADIYRAVLDQNVASLLRHGQSLEFFIEGGRSRDGYVQPPKLGLLRSITRWVAENVDADALIVPVTLSYEHVFEMRELVSYAQGLPKAPESFFSVVQSFLGLMFGKHASARVDLSFSPAISVRDITTDNDSDQVANTLATHIHAQLVSTAFVTSTAVVSYTLLGGFRGNLEQLTCRSRDILPAISFRMPHGVVQEWERAVERAVEILRTHNAIQVNESLEVCIADNELAQHCLKFYAALLIPPC